MSLVSIIVTSHPAYQKYLSQALDSLKHHDQEIILIEDGEGHLSKACNNAISHSKGDYIVRVDADDWIAIELIDLQKKYLDTHPEIDCVWVDYWEAYQIGDKIHKLKHHPNPTLEHACGAMYRRKVWGVLKYDEELRYQESYDFWRRFEREGFKAHHIEVPLYYYRKGHNSMSTNPERDRVREQLERKYAKKM